MDELQAETGLDVGYSTEGLLCLASSEEAADVLRRRYDWQRKAGFEVELISSAGVHEMEPLVTAPIAAAAFMPGERSVTPRRLVNALREACFVRRARTTNARIQSNRAGSDDERALQQMRHLPNETPPSMQAPGDR